MGRKTSLPSIIMTIIINDFYINLFGKKINVSDDNEYHDKN